MRIKKTKYGVGTDVLIKYGEISSGPVEVFRSAAVVEWLKRRARDQHGLGSKLTRAILSVFGKDTLRHIPLLGGAGKQF